MILAWIGLCFLLQNPIPGTLKASNPPQKHPSSTQQSASDNQRGTEDSPIVVKILPTPKTPEESAQGVIDRQEKTSSDWWLDFFTGILAFMAVVQAIVFAYQGRQLRKTVQAAEGQSIDMKKSIAESARAANAMETVAQHLEASTKAQIDSMRFFSERGEMQMRAYIGVDFHTAAFQSQETKFGAVVRMTNFGPTPAHKVRFSAKAEILPQPLPDDFAFHLSEMGSPSVIGPHQSRTITTFVENVVPETDIDGIKFLRGSALCMWGTIEYEDAFSRAHVTTFSLLINWSGQNVFATYLPTHNEAT